MFEQALIVRAGMERQVDLGLLAETLFFYGSVHFLLNSGSEGALAKHIPGDAFLELLDRQSIKVSYVRDNFGVVSTGSPRVHDFGSFMFYGSQKNRKAISHQEEIEISLERALGKSAATGKLAKAIGRRVVLHRYKG